MFLNPHDNDLTAGVMGELLSNEKEGNEECNTLLLIDLLAAVEEVEGEIPPVNWVSSHGECSHFLGTGVRTRT